METKKATYGEIFRISINPGILVGSHLMVEFEKEQDFENVAQGLKSNHKEFGVT